MPIDFIPDRGAILICDFDLARVPPEMDKARRVIVVSPRAYNHRHAKLPGLCQVVPLSMSKPRGQDDRSILIPKGRYRSITENVWAKTGLVTTVSHDRLDRPFVARRYQRESISSVDMEQIESALMRALGLTE